MSCDPHIPVCGSVYWSMLFMHGLAHIVSGAGHQGSDYHICQ